MKVMYQTLIAIVAVSTFGCAEWHSSGPSASETGIGAWSQVRVGMERQRVYELMGKPRRETADFAEWRGPEVRKSWPSDYPSRTYWRQYEASFDVQGRVACMRDFDQAAHQ